MMEHSEENHNNLAGDTMEPPSLGRTLREARERLGLNVAAVAGQTKLAPRQIEALEADDFARLPEMPFVRGFVRSYAKILHLDAQPLLALLPATAAATTGVTPVSVEAPFPTAPSAQRMNLILLGAALLLAVAVVAFAVWHYTTPLAPVSSEPAVVTGAPQPTPVEPIPEMPVPPAPEQPVATETAVPQPSPEPAAPSAAQPVPVPEAPPQKVEERAKSAATESVPAAKATLRLTFNDESWVDVRDRDGNIVSSQINARGSELYLDGKAPLTLAIGRANSVRLYYKGKPVDLKPHTNDASEVARLTLE